MRRYFYLLALILGFAAAGCDKTEEHWIRLCNGENLDGWTVKISGHEVGDNFGDTFRVEDGVLKVCYDKYEEFDGKFGHIFYGTPFSHYIVRFEYRFVGEQVPGGPDWAFRNNGIMLHSQSPQSMGADQDFPVSIEAQLLGGDGINERRTGNVCTPGTHIVINNELITDHCVSSRSRTYHGDLWVRMEVEVHGDEKILHRVNGEIVLEYERPQLDENDADAAKLLKDGGVQLSEGYIALQAESHPTEFRKIELKRLMK